MRLLILDIHHYSIICGIFAFKIVGYYLSIQQQTCAVVDLAFLSPIFAPLQSGYGRGNSHFALILLVLYARTS